ncbi:transglycosylase domain-containing protein [Sediminibacillus massiliensis]|uniref:transglycosylase domain-containing protein n=1 Tax=Sediminibacillus massiliensis TaxID=1926277 RepID=UPI0009884700|nr:PBP1A family penicillin-binding protein [Sediminibacillus massiliensis]
MAENSQSRTARRKQLKKKKKPLWKNAFKIIGIIILLIGLGIGGLFTYYIVTAPKLDADKLSVPASTKVLTKDGEEFANLGDQKRTKIEYDDLPPILIDAVTATEDSRFFSHIGIDFRRIGAAVLANFRSGFGAEGASTITQQVIKGSFLSPEKTLERKVQEQWLALRLDSQYSKEEILEMYLNRIYYGNVYGVAEAADFYFGKEDLSELTLPEAALLAGLPQRPSAYDPTKNPDLAQERMNTVLSLMVQHNKITEEEAEETRQVKVESMLVDSDSRPDSSPYEAFLQQVQKEVKEKLDADIYSDGLEVHTTLDPAAQEQVEFLLSNSDDNPIQYPDNEFQAGVSVLDTSSGAIRAIGGGRKFDDSKGGWNYAIDGNGRQPGSTIKPITVYGPAIEHNQWSTYHQINDDAPYQVGDSAIRNWNRTFQGWVSMRYALEQSLNVPAAKTLEEIGYDVAQPFAEGLGIEFADDRMTIRDAIGGTETGVTSLQMAGAYSAFGNKGIYTEPYSVTKVVYSDGRTVELEPESEPAMHEYTAYMITDMLKSVVTEGTGTRANVPGLPVAGKTGTTNVAGGDGANNAWFSGYTTDYTIAVWTGYDQSSTTIPSGYTQVGQDIFRETMAKISQGKETADFEKPDSVVEVAVEKGSNPARLPSEYTPQSSIVTELFVKGHEPSKTSQRFDRLDPVSGLSASYNEESNSIEATWNYEGDEDVAFEISAGTGGSLNNLSTTDDKSIEISSVDPGTTYTISVKAISDNDSSEAVSVQVEVPGEEEEEEEQPEDNADEQEEDQQQDEENQEDAPQDQDGENDQDNQNGNDDNGQGNNNGNPGNNEGNGNGNGNGNNGNNEGGANNENGEGSSDNEADNQESNDNEGETNEDSPPAEEPETGNDEQNNENSEASRSLHASAWSEVWKYVS